MEQHHIDVILFDLGGVLIELTGVEQMLGWSPGVASSEELWHRWLHSEGVRRFETGAISEAEFAAAMVAEFEMPVSAAEFLRAFHAWPRAPFPGAKELLAELAPRYQLASVSNTNAGHWGRFVRDWSLDAAFHFNFPSHLVGKLKPDREYFEHVLAAVAVPAERVLFLDDNQINVDAATPLGLVAHRAVGVVGARRVLAELGVHGASNV